MPVETTPPTAGEKKPRRAARPTRSTSTRTPSPTRPIEPGIVHERIAIQLLKYMQKRSAQAGYKLDVGELPEGDVADTSADDPEELSKILTHAIARLGDRIPFTRKFSRSAEGQNKKAGIVSDLLAALWTLYKRNPADVEQLAGVLNRELQKRRANKLHPNNPQ